MHEKAIPPHFCKIERGDKLLVLRKDLSEELLRLGVENPWEWARSEESQVRYYSGRVPAAALTLPLNGGLRVVLRRYHHGGLLGGLQKDLYLFSFPPLKEMTATEFARDRNIPVAEILGAVQQKVGKFFYRVDLLTRHLPEGIDLADYFRKRYLPSKWKEKRALAAQLGDLIRKMHDAGIYHSDLHLKNIYLSHAGNQAALYLLDFDKAHLIPNMPLEYRIKNLIRLQRYTEKYFSSAKIFTGADRLVFLRAYFGSEKEAVEFARKYRKKFERHVRWHQIIWHKKWADPNWWVYAAAKGVVACINALPEKWAEAGARGIARAGFILDRKHRARVLNNLSHVYGEDLSENERKVLAKKHFEQLAYFALEVTRTLTRTEEQNSYFRQENEFVGDENLDLGLKRGKGILLMISHFGNWEVLALTALIHSFKLYALAKSIKNPWIDSWISQIRRSMGIHVLKANRLNREILQILKQNDAVAMLIDQNPGGKGEWIPFLGKPAPTNTAPAYFALKSGAAVIPAYAIRKAPGQFKVIIEPPLELIHKEDFREAVKANTELFAQNLEKYVRQYPEQWFWVHNRWKDKSKKR